MNSMDAVEFLNQNIVVDSHLDLLYDLVIQRKLGRKNVLIEDYIDDFKLGGVNIIVSSIFIEDEFLPEMALRKALNQINALYEEVEEARDHFSLCVTYNDIVKTINDGKIGILLSFEGVEPLINDISLLPIFYRLGVRLIGLTWSRRNFAADGCFYSPTKEGKKGGLTNFGVKIIEKAEELGMIIDVSHLNDEGFTDVIKYSSQPVIASHSNSRQIVNSMRNLTDNQIKDIAKTNGVIGINNASIFVSLESDKANISGFVDHMQYITSLVGHQYIGLGFDFCDRIMNSFSSNVDGLSKTFDTIKGHSEIPKLIEEMSRRNFSQEQISNIMGNNYMRVFEKVLK